MVFDLKDTDFSVYAERVKKLNEGKQQYLYIQTFGCQQNEADSEKIAGIAGLMGYVKIDRPESADLIILNTCAIRKHAEEKALSMLGMFKVCKRNNPDLIIGICGCMAAEPHISELLKNEFHYVSFAIEPNMIHRLAEVIYDVKEKSKRTFIIGEDKGDISEDVPLIRTSAHKAWVSIMYGCNNFCSYCIVPYVRGRERSRNADDIVRECKELVNDGCKEITLLGQNVNSYRGECDFPGLLKKIAEIEGDFIIRFMTSHPKDVSDELIDVMARYTPKIAPYFHLPLQSGSNRILREMHRTYDREKFLLIAEKLRKAVPDICLSTDVIIGFPGETDDDFEDTMDVLRKVKFDMVYSFKYSPREGTPAAKMLNPVSEDIKEKRMSRLLKMQDEFSLENNEKYIGRTVRVLVDDLSRRKEFNTVSARTYTNKLVHFQADEKAIGEFRYVKIEKAGGFDLTGTEVK